MELERRRSGVDSRPRWGGGKGEGKHQTLSKPQRGQRICIYTHVCALKHTYILGRLVGDQTAQCSRMFEKVSGEILMLKMGRLHSL